MSNRNPNTLLAVPSEDTFDFLFKVVLIGDCGTGKTCVVQRFKTGNYIESHGNTIGVDFSMKTISIDGKKVKVSHANRGIGAIQIDILDSVFFQIQIWDTAGQERFRTITQSYYRSANGVIIGETRQQPKLITFFFIMTCSIPFQYTIHCIVYDITKRASFLSIQRWIEEVRRYTTSNVALILVGNKCDLEEEREVDFSEAEAMCECIPEILFVMETSAKDNTNIENIFKSLAAELKVN